MHRRTTLTTLSGIAILFIISLCAFFIWPTRYRYDHVSAPGYSGPIRIDRLTGKVEQVQPGVGWISAGRAQALSTSRPTDEENLPKSELNKISLQRCRASQSSAFLACEIYNGSAYRISEIIIEVTVTRGEHQPKEMHRQYALQTITSPVRPMTDGLFKALAASRFWPSKDWHSRLIAAKGTRE